MLLRTDSTQGLMFAVQLSELYLQRCLTFCKVEAEMRPRLEGNSAGFGMVGDHVTLIVLIWLGMDSTDKSH
jgi:hypothetical protein